VWSPLLSVKPKDKELRRVKWILWGEFGDCQARLLTPREQARLEEQDRDREGF
jgi:hypothetical protein